MKFITLGTTLNSPFAESEDGTISSECIGWFGVDGNKYSKQKENGQWDGFVQSARISFSAKTKDIDVIKEAALTAVNEYRTKNYPNT